MARKQCLSHTWNPSPGHIASRLSERPSGVGHPKPMGEDILEGRCCDRKATSPGLYSHHSLAYGIWSMAILADMEALKFESDDNSEPALPS